MSEAQDIVNELVSLLGLYPGAEVQPVKPVDDGHEPRLGELYVRNKGNPLRPKIVLLLAAEYFPSLVRLVSSLLDERLLSNAWMLPAKGLAWMTALLQPGGTQPYATRFVREHPGVVIKLYNNLIFWLSGLGQLHDDAYSLAKYAPRYLFVSLTNLIGYMIAESFSFPGFVLALDPTTRFGLGRVVDRVDASDPGLSSEVVRGLAVCFIPMDLAWLREGFEESNDDQIWPYWNCGARTRHNSLHSLAAARDCSEPPEGQELSMCARCRAVRYCSRTHQKEHWKQHKPFCLKPSW